MSDRTRSIDGATPADDMSGLKLSPKTYTRQEIYEAEARNIAKATLKYLSAPPGKKEAPFSYAWMQELHREMFAEVWEWAGTLRHSELSIGVKAYLVPSELKKLCDDIAYWEEHRAFELTETAARIHHRAVRIHPFLNGNGRWARMLANIYLRQHHEMPVKWQEELLAKENPGRDRYIQALRSADRGDYTALIALHRIRYA